MASILADSTHDATHGTSVEVEGAIMDAKIEDKAINQMRQTHCTKVVMGIFLFGFAVFVVVDAFTAQKVGKAIIVVLEWVEANPTLGVFVYVAFYFFATILFVPGVTFAGGFVFAHAFGIGLGVLIGSLAAFVGASAGATASFLIGRYLFRDWVRGMVKTYTIFDALEACMAEESGFRIMALLRLSPIIPFLPLNYLAGVTSISLWNNAMALLFIVPGIVVYVVLGASAGSIAQSLRGEYKNVEIVLIAVGAVFAIAAIWLTNFYVRKELYRVIEARQVASNVHDNLGEGSGGGRGVEQAEAV